MVNRYMQQERTITLAVVPAHVYMHDTEILQAAQEAILSGARTIVVITKLNLEILVPSWVFMNYC